MDKVAVIYWSGTGNTEMMAKYIAEGVNAAGGQADVFSVSDFAQDKLAEYGRFALGCPAMGAEELELGWRRMDEPVEGRRRSSRPCTCGRTARYRERP